MSKRSADMKDEDINLLIIFPSIGAGEGVFRLAAENGQILASHFCSHGGFAKGDLHDNRPERKEKYSERFGEYEVKFIDQVDDLTMDEFRVLNEEHAKLNGYYEKETAEQQ